MNSRCPCGSGKKPKACCGKKKNLPPASHVKGMYVDHRIEKFVIVTKRILRKQLTRDSLRIAATFDAALGGEIDEVSEVMADVFLILSPRLLGSDLHDKARGPTCARLLHTAVTTFTGCIYLARGGFRLQYMTLSRSVIETICSVLHMMVDPLAIDEFHTGTFKSTKSVTAANRVLPGFSRMYGELSNQFVHINTMHSGLNALLGYGKDDEDLSVIRINMRMLAWLLFVTTELVFVEEIEKPRYWHIIDQREDGNAIQYNPSPEERAWQASFFGYEAGLGEGDSNSSS